MIFGAGMAHGRQFGKVFRTVQAHQLFAGDGGDLGIKFRVSFGQLFLYYHARSIGQIRLRVYTDFYCRQKKQIGISLESPKTAKGSS